MISETFGDFAHELSNSGECLTLSFLPSARPLHERWRNNGLSADFLSDYFSTFLPSDNHHKDDIRGAVSYIANELLENAMKFCDYENKAPVTLYLDLEAVRFEHRFDYKISYLNKIKKDKS